MLTPHGIRQTGGRKTYAIDGATMGRHDGRYLRSGAATIGHNRRAVLRGLGAACVSGIAAPALALPGPLRIGALLPLTGDAEAYAAQMRMGIETAIAEINGAGGALGRELQVIYGDSATSPAVLPKVCHDMIDNQGVAAFVGPWVSAGRRYAARYLGRRKVPLVNASNHEGRFCHPTLFSVGPTVNHDGHSLVKFLDDGGAGKRYFMVGSYPSWQTSMFRQIRFPMAERDIEVLGQAQTNVGERDFTPILKWIDKVGAEVVLFCVMRRHGCEFVRQADEMALLERLQIGWIGYNETLNARLTPAQAERIHTTTPFAVTDPEKGVPGFVQRVRRLFGADTPIGYLAMTHYNAVMALRAAWRRIGDAAPEPTIAGLRGLTFDTPTGPATIDSASQHVTMNVVAARGGVDGLEIVERLGQIAPEPNCRVEDTVGEPA